MTVSDGRWRELRATFSVELDERVPELNRLLLRLEHEPESDAAPEIVDALFREAHSLKGAARAVQLPEIERTAHSLESALEELRQSGVAPSADWFDATYRTVDALKPLYQAAVDGEATQDVNARLEDVSRPSKTTEPTRDDRPAAPTSPVEPESDPGVAVRQGAGDRPGAESVRVAVGKLDALLAQTGELAVTNIRITQRLGELQLMRQNLARVHREGRAHRVMAERVGGTLDAALEATEGGRALRRELTEALDFLARTDEEQAAAVQEIGKIIDGLRQDSGQLGFVSKAIEDEVMGVRLLPVATIFSPFERMVRDLARQMGKEVRLALDGAKTEIDRKILEQLRDPLMHMVRNAVDHGLETAAERRSQGKPAAGIVRLSAAQRGGEIHIEVEDDGAGIDPGEMRRVAVNRGMLPEEQAATLDDQAALELIFQPGFSSAEAVTETSGRGVGMDVVREHVTRLNGHVAVESVPGKGTRFIIGVPLTLATTRAVLVEDGGQLFAIPSATIEYNARVRERSLVNLEGRRAVPAPRGSQGSAVPAAELSDILERPTSTRHKGADDWRPFFILRQGEARLAVLADRLIGEQEIVVKSLGWPLLRVRNVAGAAVLGSGETVVILNPSDTLKSGLKLVGSRRDRPQREVGGSETARRARRVLVVDDSLTTRTLEKSILEAAGYDTVAVADGLAALEVLRREPIDIVVSDVEMPKLDGFGLTSEIRRDEKLQQLPVVLVTSLEAQEHRERGVQVGADAYIAKSGFAQGHLLDTISRLL